MQRWCQEAPITNEMVTVKWQTGSKNNKRQNEKKMEKRKKKERGNYAHYHHPQSKHIVKANIAATTVRPGTWPATRATVAPEVFMG